MGSLETNDEETILFGFCIEFSYWHLVGLGATQSGDREAQWLALQGAYEALALLGLTLGEDAAEKLARFRHKLQLLSEVDDN